MGNFISNQRIETMDGVDNAAWTERGVLMDVTLEKRIVKPRLRQLKRIQPGLTAHLREQFRQRISFIYLSNLYFRGFH